VGFTDVVKPTKTGKNEIHLKRILALPHVVKWSDHRQVRFFWNAVLSFAAGMGWTTGSGKKPAECLIIQPVLNWR
jgi:hypothetical protein